MSDDDVYGRPPTGPGQQQPGQYGSYGQPTPYGQFGQVQPYAGYGGQPVPAPGYGVTPGAPGPGYPTPHGGYGQAGPPPGYGPGLTMFPQQYKDTTAAWLLWLFLAGFGAHDFYLKRTGAGVAKVVLTLVGWVTTLVFVGYVLLFAVFVWWVVDAFLMSGRLQQVNARIYAHNRAIGAAH